MSGLSIRATIAGSLLLATAAQAQRVAYPASQTINHVDDFFGTKVADPYRWMEDLNSPDVAKWVAAENRVSSDYLAALPMRAAFKDRLTRLWNYAKTSVPYREGGRLWYTKNTGLQRQNVWFSRRTIDGPEQMAIDPNTFSADGSVALASFTPAPDGVHTVYGVSQGGADWCTMYVKDLSTGKQLADSVRWLKGCGMSWTRDSKGFYYSRYPEPEAGKQLQNALRDQKIYYHRVGTSQAEDKLIYQRPDQPEWFVGGGVSDDGRWLVVFVNRGTEPQNRLYVADLGDPRHPRIDAPIRPVFEKGDASYSPIGNVGETVYLQTDLNAPRGKIVAFDLANPSPDHWRTVVPESKNPIDQVAMFKGGIAVAYLEDVKSKVLVYGLDGRARGAVPLPGIGTVAGLAARNDTPDFFYAFTSPLYPTSVFHYDPASATNRAWFTPKLAGFDPARYETRALFATSKDGTKVPVFVTMRRGLTLDGSHPTILYGYGGFDISITPSFGPHILSWIERGGVWATASMRGGAEYGEEWHRAGMFEKKQNVFDDFIAAAEHLVHERYSSPEHLAIQGGSNGGLLIGAVMEQRPDLFAAALPAVGVMDMLRYHKFTGGSAWATEYGSADDSTAFKYLSKYSPVHNVKAGRCYPATLVTTADHDDRVVPSHSFKFTAAMQTAQGCDKPILIRVETQASHGYRPTDKRIAELADEWAFAANFTGMRASNPIVP